MTLTLTDIPSIMRYHGWYNGARLMDIWFARPSAIAPAYGPADTTTITMDGWVLTFDEAREVYNDIVREAIWTNPPAQREIGRMLGRKGLLQAGGSSFGDLTAAVEALDEDYINQRRVEASVIDDLTDISAALGNFNIRVVVAGSVQPAPEGGWTISLEQVGAYVADSYDFEGDQFLGYWDADDNTVSALNPIAGSAVTNADFRQWRSNTGNGGDFRVFSDVKLIPLVTPYVFYFTP